MFYQTKFFKIIRELLVTPTYPFFLLFNKNKTFQLNNKKYHYCQKPYNRSWFNERTVEIPLATHFLKNYPSDQVLELGNVSSHYQDQKHLVIDKYEKAKMVKNQDITTFKSSKKYQFIFSLSTLEHVGWDEKPKNPPQTILAIKNLYQHLSLGGVLLFTIPLGYNSYLDQQILNQRLKNAKTYFLTRNNFFNRWQEKKQKELLPQNMSYDFLFMRAKTIAVVFINK